MMAVACAGVSHGRVALKADLAARRAQGCGMGLVAVAAGDAGREHLALFERAVIVCFLHVPHLSVGFVDPARERRDHVRVGERPARPPSF